MHLEIIILSEVSQTEKSEHHMIYMYVCVCVCVSSLVAQMVKNLPAVWET